MPFRVRYVRLCPNGRHEVRCTTCENFFWPTGPELFAWTECPHCEGWWLLVSKVPWDWPDSLVTGVTDGDTFTAKVRRDLGFHGEAYFDVRMRLNRVNAPASTSVRGKAATVFARQQMEGVTVHVVTTGPYKYGDAWMAEVTLADGRNVSDMLVEAGLAVYWDGKGPRPADS